MKYTEARTGRIFILRLEDGDRVHTCIEQVAAAEKIERAVVWLVGGADAGSTLIVGPEKDRELPVHPMEHVLTGTHEAAGVGTIFPDETGRPVLHMHAACGRKDATVTGCVRAGVDIWHIGEVVIQEITGCGALRKKDPVTGFGLLEVE